MIPSLVGFGFSTPLSERTGYFKIQGTRPQTLSYGLTGSPAGQLRGSWRSSRGGPTPRCICLRMPCLAIDCWPTRRCTGSPAPLGRRPTSTTRHPRPHAAGAVGCAHGRRGLSGGSGHPSAYRAPVQHHPLERLRHRRALRRDGDAAIARRRHPRVLRNGGVIPISPWKPAVSAGNHAEITDEPASTPRNS